jgi:hypothetical protein
MIACSLQAVREIMREPRRRINYLRGKESGDDYVRFSTDWPRTALRQHRKLQNHHSCASGSDGQKPLPDSGDEIDVAHVYILR